MELLLKYLLLLLTLTSLEVSMTTSFRQSEKRRFKTDRAHLSNSNSNICNITDRESKVHCYCESTRVKSATRADCWVFNGGTISEDDIIWSSFASQPNLERLGFNVRSDGALTFIPNRAIHRLHRLQELTVQYATVHRISSHSFANSSTLREVTLTRNRIVELERYAFSHIKNLVNLSLDENGISVIERHVFVDLPNLQRLCLSNNNISILHDGCFKHLYNLQTLELDLNSITILTRESFQGLANLSSLDLRSNKLIMLGDLTFMELWNLKELLLDYNEIKFVSERAFDGLSQLKRLSMADNRLVNLDEGLLEGVRGLVMLDLRNNRLDTLTHEAVRPLLDNMKTSGVMFIDGNQLVCDCRLSWLHNLRNDTTSDSLKNSLDKTTCIVDPILERRLSDSAPERNRRVFKVTINKSHRQEPESADNSEMLDDQIYEDLPPKYWKDDGQKKVFDIPVEMLPCPRKLVELSTYSPPTPDEVRQSFSASSRVMSSVFVSVAALCSVA